MATLQKIGGQLQSASSLASDMRVVVEDVDDHEAWLLPVSALQTGTTVGLSVVLDGGGSTLTTSNAADIEVPFAATITAARAFADTSGSITVTIKRAASGAFPPSTSIVASAPITISASTSGSSALTGWTTSLAAGDTLRFELSSITSIKRLTVALTLTRA